MIYNYVTRTYGTSDAYDILFFQQELKRWDLDFPFNNNMARMRRNFAALAEVHMLTSDVKRVAALIAATTHVPSISGIVNNYKTLNPAIADQNFAALAAYIQVQIPNATAQARANAAVAAAANSAAREKTNDTMAADLAVLRAEVAALTLAAAHSTATIPASAKRGARAPVKIGKPSAADKAQWTPGRPYCWQHGFTMHLGSGCTMLKTAPQWKRDALNPGPINGEYGSRNLE